MPYSSSRDRRIEAYLDSIYDEDRPPPDRPERDYRDDRYERPRDNRPPDRPQYQERESQADYYARVSPGVYDEEGRRIRNPLANIVNDPDVTVTAEERKAINDPKKAMTDSGKIVTLTKAQMAARARMLNPVQRAGLYPPIKPKRTRKKSKMDKTMSTCLKMANARYRKKNGQLKKGKTMSDVMKMAHRLCRKHG
jgi:hypothetical protein